MGVLLIALGVIMITARLNGWQAVEYIIKWWPAVLILLGAEIVVTSLLFKSEGTKIKVDGFSIAMIIFILFICLGAYGAVSLFNGASFHIDGFHPGSKYHSRFNKSFSINADGRDKIEINNEFGNVTVSRGSGDSVEIEAEIEIDNNDEEYAKNISESIISVDDGSPIVITAKPQEYYKGNGTIRNVSIDYTVKVPENLSVYVKNSFGGIDIRSAPRSVNVENSHGSVNTNSIAGDLYIENSFASVNVNGVGGKAEVHNRNGSVIVKNVNGSLTVENEFASVKVSDIKGNAKITDKNGSVDAEKIGGNLEIDNKFGSINAYDISGNIDITGGNGKIEASSIGGDAAIYNEFGGTELADAYKYIKITSKNGSIKVSSSKAIEKGMDITNQFGNITIELPREQQGYFNASTQYGQITSDFNLNIDKGMNQEKIEGQIGRDQPVFNIKNKNDGIKILYK